MSSLSISLTIMDIEKLLLSFQRLISIFAPALQWIYINFLNVIKILKVLKNVLTFLGLTAML
jgi:hypothetical protein